MTNFTDLLASPVDFLIFFLKQSCSHQIVVINPKTTFTDFLASLVSFLIFYKMKVQSLNSCL